MVCISGSLVHTRDAKPAAPRSKEYDSSANLVGNVLASVTDAFKNTLRTTCFYYTGTIAFVMFHSHDVKFSRRIPGPSPLTSAEEPAGTLSEGKHKAWLLGVINDRFVNGVQEFLCNWEGSSPHQWVQGRELECNVLLEEYSHRTGRRLDWRCLEGEPLLAEGVSKVRKFRAPLDWEIARAPKRKLQGTTEKANSLSRRARPLLPRPCKYLT